MAMELESKIMEEIGLGNHYNWHNGSGSCYHTRIQATLRLPKVIKTHADAGDEIAQPDKELIAIAKRIALTEEGMYVLTKTWQVCSYIIASHIHAHHDKKALARTKKFLEESYPTGKTKRSVYHG